jgi:hypothetical protein
MKNKTKDLLKLLGLTAMILTFAVIAFAGVNDIARAAATQPEPLPAPAAQAVAMQTSTAQTTAISHALAPQDTETQSAYEEPKLNVLLDESLDENGKPLFIPGANVMSPEEAAQIGALYVWDMTGESIDGKTVKMLYSAPQFSSKAYWYGTVANSASDLNFPQYTAADYDRMAAEGVSPPKADASGLLYDFCIDALTGESVSINLLKIKHDLDSKRALDADNDGILQLTRPDDEGAAYEAPDNVDEYAAAARAFAGKHFRHTTVRSVEFSVIKYGIGAETASFHVTDSTGRVAYVDVDMETKQALHLNTSDSDIVPGYDYQNADYAG